MASYKPAHAAPRRPRFTAAQLLALATGAVLTAAGIAGFFVTDLESWDDVAHHATGDELLGFELNPLHNVVHLVLGVIGLMAGMRLRATFAYGLLLAAGYGAVAVFGLFALGEDWNVLSLNTADNWLHLGLAALGAIIAAAAYLDIRTPLRTEPVIDLRDLPVRDATDRVRGQTSSSR